MDLSLLLTFFASLLQNFPQIMAIFAQANAEGRTTLTDAEKAIIEGIVQSAHAKALADYNAMPDDPPAVAQAKP